MSEEIKQEPKVETQPETKSPVPVARMSVEMEGGVVVAKTLDEAYRYAVAIHKSGLAPASFDSPEKVMIAMQTASELGLPPLTSLKSMYVLKGNVALFGDLPLALVRKSGHLDFIIEQQFDKDRKLINSENNNLEAECAYASCKIKRKNETETVREFSWAEAVKAGLDKDKWGDKVTYKNFRKRMLQMKARSWALKDVFPDVLLGIALEYYDDHEPKDVTPKQGLKQVTIEDENEIIA
jgi:hypothetical protein